jgi:hypothetical protein
MIYQALPPSRLSHSPVAGLFDPFALFQVDAPIGRPPLVPLSVGAHYPASPLKGNSIESSTFSLFLAVLSCQVGHKAPPDTDAET